MKEGEKKTHMEDLKKRAGAGANGSARGSSRSKGGFGFLGDSLRLLTRVDLGYMRRAEGNGIGREVMVIGVLEISERERVRTD